MAKRRRKPKYEVPKPKVEQSLGSNPKYRVGEKGLPFNRIADRYPVFSFNYLSWAGSELCANAPGLGRDDLVGLLDGLRRISQVTYGELLRQRTWRFHTVDLESSKVSLNQDDFLKVLAPSGRGMNEDDLPTLYQFDLQFIREARAVGFLYFGVFYLVWYDRYHKLYPRK